MTETFNVSYLSKRWFNWHMHPRLLLQAMGGFKHAIGLIFLLVAHLNFIIYLHGANMGPNKLVILCCQMCVWMQHIKLCFRLWLIQLGLCPSHMPLDSAINQCRTVEKKVTDRRRICRQSIGNKITLLWLLQDHVLIKKTSKKQTNTWWNRCIQVWFIRWLELTGLQ